jgi:uncharacterized membrane protein (DUF373 family)
VSLIRFLVVDQNLTVDFLNYQSASARLRHLLHVLLLIALWETLIVVVSEKYYPVIEVVSTAAPSPPDN